MNVALLTTLLWLPAEQQIPRSAKTNLSKILRIVAAERGMTVPKNTHVCIRHKRAARKATAILGKPF
jgi:hypothetical protein